jgi:putative membrane protein
MKNLINLKSILVYTMCIVGTLVIASSCSENRTNDSRDVAENENKANLTSDNRTGDHMTTDNRTAVVIENDNDAQFLMDAAEMQHEEIRLGQLAQQKGNSAHVKELGKMMEADHSKALNELQALAQSKSIAIPTSATDDSMDAYNKLNEENGNDFEKAYSDLMVEHHEDAIELYEKAATDSEDPAIRAWATEKLPGLRTHLQHAKSAKEKSDNTKS